MDQIISKTDVFTVLFSIRTLVDTDMGLLNYVFDEYRNEDIFDLNVLDYKELVNMVYYRQFENPLYIIMRHPEREEDLDFLDECYMEFASTKCKEILRHSLATNIVTLIQLFKEESSIIPYVMCYTEDEYRLAKAMIELKDIEILSVAEVLAKGTEFFSQFYFKYIEETTLFLNCVSKTFYISSCGLNMNADKTDIKDFKFLPLIVKANNQINVFDMYREEDIGKDVYLNGNDQHQESDQ